jgi:hypothetical protein
VPNPKTTPDGEPSAGGHSGWMLDSAPNFIGAKYAMDAMLAGTHRMKTLGILHMMLDYIPDQQQAKII